MNELNISKEYNLDEKSQKDLLKSELKTDIENLSEELNGYKINSDKEIAWIVSIDEEEKNKITVKFLLPSTDTFTHTYSIPDKTLPEDNLFRNLIESTGYDINSIGLTIGESIDIKYNEKMNKWEPKIHSKFKNNKSKNTGSSNSASVLSNSASIKINKLIHYTVLFLLLIPFLLILIRYTRGYGILVIISVYIGYYLITN